ncbi:MAG: response regulator [Phycisphaerales bacterium]
MDTPTPSPAGTSARPGLAPVSLHLLLADDNEMNQDAGRRILERRGHTVVIAANGLEVLARLEKEKFDLVLMDMQMPDMDGLTATARIRENEKASGAHLLIVAMTSNAMSGDRERCLEGGMDGYVSKPVNRKELFDTIEGLTATQRPASAAPPVAPPPPPPAAAAHTKPLIDRAELMENLGDDHDLLVQLAATFHATGPKLLGDLRAAFAAGDAPGVEQWSHKLAGKFGVFFAHDAVKAARELEGLARAGNLAAAAPSLARLETHSAAFTAALKDLTLAR